MFPVLWYCTTFAVQGSPWCRHSVNMHKVSRSDTAAVRPFRPGCQGSGDYHENWVEERWLAADNIKTWIIKPKCATYVLFPPVYRALVRCWSAAVLNSSRRWDVHDSETRCTQRQSDRTCACLIGSRIWSQDGLVWEVESVAERELV
jgi:hypothetical protein